MRSLPFGLNGACINLFHLPAEGARLYCVEGSGKFGVEYLKAGGDFSKISPPPQ